MEADLKVITRWYLVPTRITKFYPNSSPLCFRGCGHVGSLLHTFWECPKIRGFWNGIFHIIRKTTGYAIQQNPTIALLNYNIPRVPRLSRSLIHFILLGAKITLAHAWKKPSVSLRQAKQKISWIMTQEKVSSSILDTSDKFRLIWEPWARFLGLPPLT